MRHTDPALGFRVDLEGCAVTYISDHGPGCVPDDPDDYVPDGVLDLCDGVDVLIHDAQHTSHEYEAKRHFGHSSIDYAVHVAREAGAKTLVLFHHCPTHCDDDVDQILEHAQDLSAESTARDHRRARGHASRPRPAVTETPIGMSERPETPTRTSSARTRTSSAASLGQFATGVTIITAIDRRRAGGRRRQLVHVGVARSAAGALLRRPHVDARGRASRRPASSR